MTVCPMEDEDYIEDEEITTGSTYLAYWDCLGFEGIFNLTEEHSKAVMAALAGTEYKPEFNLNYMVLRARYNSQRDPEIWTFNVSGEVSMEDVQTMADENPQALVDFIRKHGQPYYRGDRVKQKRIIV